MEADLVDIPGGGGGGARGREGRARQSGHLHPHPRAESLLEKSLTVVGPLALTAPQPRLLLPLRSLPLPPLTALLLFPASCLLPRYLLLAALAGVERPAGAVDRVLQPARVAVRHQRLQAADVEDGGPQR